MTFPCSSCGACCKRVGWLVQLGFGFPYKTDETGRCEMLTDDNKCSVYDDRPDICNVGKLAETYGLPKEEFFSENIKACNQMMDEDNIPEQYRIK